MFCAILRGEKVCLVIVCKFAFYATHIQQREKACIKIEMYYLELNTLNLPQLVQGRLCFNFCLFIYFFLIFDNLVMQLFYINPIWFNIWNTL